MDGLTTDLAGKILNQGQGPGWVFGLACLLLMAWTLRSQTRQRERDDANAAAFMDAARELISAADANYGKRRRTDQLVAEALAQRRASGKQTHTRALARALATTAEQPPEVKPS